MKIRPVNFLEKIMLVITDNRIAPSSLAPLESLGFKAILMPAAPYLQPGVASHTDMLLFIGFDRIFCHRRYYEDNLELLEKISRITGYELTVSDELTGEKYPHDVLFNACLLGKRLICNEKTVSKLILDAAKAQNYEIVNVSQGYTKCSVCPVSDNAIITSDKTISKTCADAGIDVLTVSEGHISLPPYNYGFIGGTSGIFRDKVYFCGSLDHHPDGESMNNFCKKHRKTAISLSSDSLKDVGSLLFIETK